MKYKLIFMFIVICLVVLLGFQYNKILIYSNTLGTEVSITLSDTYQLYHEVLVSYGEGTIDSIDDSEIEKMLSEFEDSTVLHSHFYRYRVQLINGTMIELIESTNAEEQKELYQFAIELEEETYSLISYAYELSGGEKGIDPFGNDIVLHPGDMKRFASLCNKESTNYKKFNSKLEDVFNRERSKLESIVDKYEE